MLFLESKPKIRNGSKGFYAFLIIKPKVFLFVIKNIWKSNRNLDTLTIFWLWPKMIFYELWKTRLRRLKTNVLDIDFAQTEVSLKEIVTFKVGVYSIGIFKEVCNIKFHPSIIHPSDVFKGNYYALLDFGLIIRTLLS